MSTHYSIERLTKIRTEYGPCGLAAARRICYLEDQVTDLKDTVDRLAESVRLLNAVRSAIGSTDRLNLINSLVKQLWEVLNAYQE